MHACYKNNIKTACKLPHFISKRHKNEQYLYKRTEIALYEITIRSAGCALWQRKMPQETALGARVHLATFVFTLSERALQDPA